MLIHKFLIFVILNLISFISKDANIIEEYTHLEEAILKEKNDLPSEIKDNHYGKGLFATKDLKPGTLVAFNTKIPINKTTIRNIYRLSFNGFKENNEPLWSQVLGKGRFCNHSCDPNCILNNQCTIITARYIKSAEELTTAYDEIIEGLTWPAEWTFKCQCNAKNCRKLINGYKINKSS
jgi:hypothetical protein